ncbi:MAG: cytochrome b/b6 domain-containing protein [Hyphomicrobiales bacterium]|nr:cytochrome b/b6 domain-containing protein [Hyphomicrobiales bacterium]
MSEIAADDSKAPTTDRPPKQVIYRHRVTTRLTHWINVVCFTVLLMSGLQILNAHPALYWGQFGADDDHAFIQFYASRSDGELVGHTRIGSWKFTTTGLFGASAGNDGELTVRAMPTWATLPSFRDLATGRRWHFFFAWLFVINGLVYVSASLITGHFRRDLLPSWRELKPGHILRDVWSHARLKFPKGEAAKRYNVLQKGAYLGVVVLLALLVLTGLTMSPGINAAVPGMLDLFGGRQSARTIHFICAALMVAFIVIHLAMVVLAGPINEIRSMITGRYVVPPEDSK